jgi:hypothetical protein
VLKNNPSLNGFTRGLHRPDDDHRLGEAVLDLHVREVFNGQVIIKFSTDGKIWVAGKLNFAADNLSVSGRLYADLSKVQLGRGHGPVPGRRPGPGSASSRCTAA